MLTLLAGRWCWWWYCHDDENDDNYDNNEDDHDDDDDDDGNDGTADIDDATCWAMMMTMMTSVHRTAVNK